MSTSYRYRPVLFFLLTAIVTWVPWFVGIYLGSRRGAEGTASLLNLVGLLAPLVVGLSLIFTSGSPALKRDLADRITDLRRIRPRDVLLAIVIPPVVIVLSIWISVALGESRDQLGLAGGEGLIAMIVLALVLAPIIEEVGWRGYGVDSLRAEVSALPATLLFGVLWSLWHAPLVIMPGTYQHQLANMDNPLFLINFFVSVIPAAIVANWLYWRNGRSILVGVFFHALLNAAAVLINAGQVAKTIATVLYTAIAVAIIAGDRRVFGAGPRNFIEQPAPERPREVSVAAR